MPDDEVAPKKDQIIALYDEGITDIADLVRRVAARPSYVAQVLEHAGYKLGYSGNIQTVYARFFRNVLHLETVAEAEKSCKQLTRLHDYFERLGDREGQHQSMVVALTGRNRARWAGHGEVAEIFGQWLASH
jgi:hypothetical protein